MDERHHGPAATTGTGWNSCGWSALHAETAALLERRRRVSDNPVLAALLKERAAGHRAGGGSRAGRPAPRPAARPGCAARRCADGQFTDAGAPQDPGGARNSRSAQTTSTWVVEG